MVDTFVILPIIIPFAIAILTLFLWGQRKRQQIVTVLGMALSLAIAVVLFLQVQETGPMALQVGGWDAPIGISLVADLLSTIMVVITALVGFAVAIYSIVDIDPQRENYGYYPLYNILVMGITGAFLTGDIFNLYVWFEVMLISSFVLLALGGERRQVEGDIKYVTLNLLSSALFLVAVGLLYGATGTLNMAQLAQIMPNTTSPALTTSLATLFLIAFGIKAGIFPLYHWLPAAYHTPPAAVSAIFAGMLTKVGVYALIRVFMLFFTGETAVILRPAVLTLAGVTMVIGVFGAATQMEIRRILSFHIISQIGYMIMGLGLAMGGASVLGLVGAVYYIIHHIVVKANLFLIGGVINTIQGSYHLKKVGGFYKAYPFLSILFLIPALSLAGIPPLSGFWAKFVLVRAGLEVEAYAIVAASLFVSMLTLYSMTKIWAYAFWSPQPEEAPAIVPLKGEAWLSLLLPVVLLATCTVVIGLSGEWVYGVAEATAVQLLDPSIYISTVMGGS